MKSAIVSALAFVLIHNLNASAASKTVTFCEAECVGVDFNHNELILGQMSQAIAPNRLDAYLEMKRRCEQRLRSWPSVFLARALDLSLESEVSNSASRSDRSSHSAAGGSSKSRYDAKETYKGRTGRGWSQVSAGQTEFWFAESEAAEFSSSMSFKVRSDLRLNVTFARIDDGATCTSQVVPADWVQPYEGDPAEVGG